MWAGTMDYKWVELMVGYKVESSAGKLVGEKAEERAENWVELMADLSVAVRADCWDE